MQLKTFLRTFNENYIHESTVPACFVISHKCAVPDLSTRIVECISHTLSCNVVAMASHTFDTDTWMSQLVTTFLGKRTIITLPSPSSSGARARAVRDFLSQYTGPHYILYTDGVPAHSKNSNNAMVITIPDKIGVQEITDYTRLFFTPTSVLYKIIKSIGLARPIITLEQLCRIDRYAACLPVAISDEHICQLFGDMFEQRSLFQLSHALFLRDGKSFCAVWVTVKNSFPGQFWLNYFSELVWAAYRYVYSKKKGHIVDSVTERKLPFSFTRSSGWRHWSLKQLVGFHAVLMHADAIIKQGGKDDIIELVIQMFLADSLAPLVSQLQRYT